MTADGSPTARPVVPTPAHIGFFSDRHDRIGQFQALLYVADDGDWNSLYGPLGNFFARLAESVVRRPKPGPVSRALVAFLELERGVGNVRIADELDIYVRWFHKITLAGTGWLESYQVRYVSWEGVASPEGAPEFLGIDDHIAELWAADTHPLDWKVMHGGPLWQWVGRGAGET